MRRDLSVKQIEWLEIDIFVLEKKCPTTELQYDKFKSLSSLLILP